MLGLSFFAVAERAGILRPSGDGPGNLDRPGPSAAGGTIMQVAQSGIFALGTGSHSYLEFDLHTESDPLALLRLIADLGEPRMTTGGVNLVVGVRPSLWSRAAPDDAPAGVTDFED